LLHVQPLSLAMLAKEVLVKLADEPWEVMGLKPFQARITDIDFPAEDRRMSLDAFSRKHIRKWVDQIVTGERHAPAVQRLEHPANIESSVQTFRGTVCRVVAGGDVFSSKHKLIVDIQYPGIAAGAGLPAYFWLGASADAVIRQPTH
jgi:hypothetical protein